MGIPALRVYCDWRPRAAWGTPWSALSALYPGYSVTYLGSVVGLVYGFVSGALIGAAFCWLYNRFAGTSGEPKGKSA